MAADSVREGTSTNSILNIGKWRTGTIDAEPDSRDRTVWDGSSGYVDKDWHRISLKKGDVVSVEAEAISVSTGQVFARLYDANNQRLGSNFEGEGSRVKFEFTVPKDDDYYVAISAGGSSPAWKTATGDYRVGVRMIEQAVDQSTDSEPSVSTANLYIKDLDIGSQDLSNGEVISEIFEPGGYVELEGDFSVAGAPIGSTVAALWLHYDGKRVKVATNTTKELSEGGTDTGERLGFHLPSDIRDGTHTLEVELNHDRREVEGSYADNKQFVKIAVKSPAPEPTPEPEDLYVPPSNSEPPANPPAEDKESSQDDGTPNIPTVALEVSLNSLGTSARLLSASDAYQHYKSGQGATVTIDIATVSVPGRPWESDVLKSMVSAHVNSNTGASFIDPVSGSGIWEDGHVNDRFTTGNATTVIYGQITGDPSGGARVTAYLEIPTSPYDANKYDDEGDVVERGLLGTALTEHLDKLQQDFGANPFDIEYAGRLEYDLVYDSSGNVRQDQSWVSTELNGLTIQLRLDKFPEDQSLLEAFLEEKSAESEIAAEDLNRFTGELTTILEFISENGLDFFTVEALDFIYQDDRLPGNAAIAAASTVPAASTLARDTSFESSIRVDQGPRSEPERIARVAEFDVAANLHGQDAHAMNWIPTTSRPEAQSANVGGWAGSLWLYSKFDLPVLEDGSTPTSMKLVVHVGDEGTWNRSGAIRVERVTSDWDDATLNWANKPGSADGFDVKVVSGAHQLEIDISAFQTFWTENPEQNFGIVFKNLTEAKENNSIATVDHAEVAMRPKLVVEYEVEEKAAEAEPGVPLSSKIIALSDANASDVWITNVYYDGGKDDENLVFGGWGDKYLSLLKVDLDEIPPDVEKVVLSVYNDIAETVGQTGFDVYLVEQPWDETTKWANQPSLGEKIASMEAPARQGWIDIDITGPVEKWIAGTAANYGLMFVPHKSSSNNFVELTSTEGEEEFRPYLIVDAPSLVESEARHVTPTSEVSEPPLEEETTSPLPLTGGPMANPDSYLPEPGPETNAVTTDSASTPTPKPKPIIGTSTSEVFSMSSADDAIRANAGADTVRAGGGDDLVRGGRGADRLSGDAGQDVLIGGRGDDTVFGGLGADNIRGGAGSDALFGQKGADDIRGGGGRDTMVGGGGDDLLRGGRGADRLSGDAGQDVLIGGGGADEMTGGAGADSFVFNAKHGRDVITDFKANIDVLDYSKHVGVDSFADLEIVTWGGDAVILDGFGGQVRLDGVRTSQIDADDFIF